MTDQSVDLYRLISETVTNDPHTVNGGVTYAFDGVGNRQTRVSSLSPIPTQTFTGAYDQNDRLTASGYTYDNDGNTLTDPQGNSYVYDSLDRMTQATVNGTTIYYVYDGDGNRVSKTLNSVTTNYLVDTNNLTGFPQVVDELQGGTVKKVYTYGNSLISMDDLTGTPVMHFYGKDGTGSVRFLMDSAGSITDTYDYDAFGNLTNQTHTGTPTNNVYLYDGEQFDPDLGQYYLRARYLNQVIGRFQNMDNDEGNNNNPLSMHKYLFSANDPVDKADPGGNQFDVGSVGMESAVNSIVSAQPKVSAGIIGLNPFLPPPPTLEGRLLAGIIFSESGLGRGEDYSEKITLGWMVLNRIFYFNKYPTANSAFGSNVYDVISNQSYGGQFTSFGKDTFHRVMQMDNRDMLDPKLLPFYLPASNRTHYNESVKAAEEVIPHEGELSSDLWLNSLPRNKINLSLSPWIGVQGRPIANNTAFNTPESNRWTLIGYRGRTTFYGFKPGMEGQ